MLEPENADMARGLAIMASGPGEMAVDCRTVVFRIALFDLETVCQKGVTAGGVNNKTGFPFDPAAIIMLGMNHCATVVGQEFDCFCLAVFMYFNALVLCIANQYFIELRPFHLVRVRHRFVPGICEMEGLRHFVVR